MILQYVLSLLQDVDEPMCTEEIQPTSSLTHTPSVSSIQKDSPHMRIRKPAGNFIIATHS